MKATDSIKKGDKTRYKIDGFDGIYRRGNQILMKLRVEGKTIYQPSGITYSVANLKVAQRRLIDIEDKIHRGRFEFNTEFPSSKRAGNVKSEGNATFADMANRWYQHWLEKNAMGSAHSKRGYLSILNNHFLKPGAFGDALLRDITKPMLVQWHNTLCNQKTGAKALSQSQLGKVHTIGAFIFGYAHGLEAFPSGNPWQQFKDYYDAHLKAAPKDTALSRDVPLSRKELDQIQSTIINGFDLRLTQNAIGFNAQVGLRLSELLGLTWDRVDLSTGVITIDRQLFNSSFIPCKCGSERRLQLSHGALSYLRKQHKHMLEAKPCDLTFNKRITTKQGVELTEECNGVRFVFFNPKTKSHYTDSANFARRWYATLEVCGVSDTTEQGEKRTPYTLRHTCASRMLTNGAPLDAVAAQLGNTPAVCRSRYARIIPDDQKFNIELTNKYLA